MAARYAIYYAPEAAAALYRFGAAALGYDAYTGHDTPYLRGIDVEKWPAMTREPRVYGFHATMKPPMRLKPDVSESDLVESLLAFAREQKPFDAGKAVISELGSFIAVVPDAPSDPLNALAAACVTRFDSFRAPPEEQELAKRLKSGLTERQIKHLHRWGYPYVFDDFRFHMTLTGSLPVEARAAAFNFLCEKFEQFPGAGALSIDRLVVSKQPKPGAPFAVLKEASLGG